MNKVNTPYYDDVYLRRNPLNFGYEVICVKTNEQNKRYYFRLYHTSDEQQNKEAYQALINGAKHTELPEPKKDFEPQLLIIKDKHDYSYILLKNEQDLYDAFLQEMRESKWRGEYEYLKNWNDLAEAYIITPQVARENIDSLPPRYAEIARKDWEDHDWIKKQYEKNKKTYDNIVYAVEHKSGSLAYDVLMGLHKDRYHITPFDKITRPATDGK